jgi:hypothetical protein
MRYARGVLLLAAEPSLPLMAVVALVSSAAGGAATATLSVVAFLRRQRDNARAIKELNDQITPALERIKELEKWKLQSESKHFAVKKGLPEDSPVHRLWPNSS